MVPTTLPCHFTTAGWRRSKLPRRPAPTANTTVLTRPSNTNTAPSSASCSVVEPCSGRTNCGRNARKKNGGKERKKKHPGFGIEPLGQPALPECPRRANRGRAAIHLERRLVEHG